MGGTSPIESILREFIRHERLAWDAHCNGVHADHAWGFPANNALQKIFPKPSGLRIPVRELPSALAPACRSTLVTKEV
jgi:hypothetical protein